MAFLARSLRILPKERYRFAVLASLLLVNALIVEANEVVATSGFASRVGVEGIPWVWSADMLVVVATAGAYSLVVDRTRRERLGVRLFAGFSLVYVALYLFFALGLPDWLSYSLLTVLNDQQWMLFPMLIWALAADAFSVAEAKRLFPILGISMVVGGVLGNWLTAAMAMWLSRPSRGSIELLLVSAGLLLLMALILARSSPRWSAAVHQSRQNGSVLATLQEGVEFVREVPAFRYLAIAMVLLGVGINVLEYQLIATAAQASVYATDLEAFYAMIRAIRIVLMVLVQVAVASWLMRRLGLRSVFAAMPIALLAGLALAFFWPALMGVVIGEYLGRITLEGVDEPSRRSFVGLVPDERRGRVGAFLDGYLYPLGSFVSCLLLLAVLAGIRSGLLTPDAGRALYFGLACLCAGAALGAILRFRASYESSMLNWRLKRRRRGATLAGLDL